MTAPMRGEVWLIDFDPTKGREQAGKRPGLVISTDSFNKSPADLVVVLPITSKHKEIPWHVEVSPPDGGLTMTSFIKCEDVRSVSLERLLKRLGSLRTTTVDAVEDRLRILLDL